MDIGTKVPKRKKLSDISHRFPNRASSLRRVPSTIRKITVREFRDATARLRVLPDFIIIGAQKCGTSSLYHYLTQHPFVAPAKGFIDSKKEVRFFTRHFFKGGTWYRRHFPLVIQGALFKLRRGQALQTGEATPSCTFYPHACRRVSQIVPDAKLILLLRNPVDRAYSHYQHSRRLGAEDLPFEEAIEAEEGRLRGEEEKLIHDESYRSSCFKYYSYLKRGLYAEQIETALRYIPRENLLIMQSESLFFEPTAALGRVLSHLGLPEIDLKMYEKINAGSYDEMKLSTRRQLAEYFRPHNERLFQLIGQRYQWGVSRGEVSAEIFPG